MKKLNGQKFEIETPELEIVVRAEELELAIIAFFKDGSEGWDILVGVVDPKSRDALAEALDHAAEAVRKSAFRPSPSNEYAGGDNTPPF